MNKRRIFTTIYQIGIGENVTLFQNYSGAAGQEFPKLHNIQVSDTAGTGFIDAGWTQMRTETSFAGGSFQNSIELYSARNHTLDFGEHPVTLTNGLSLINNGGIGVRVLVVYSFDDFF